MTPTSSLRFSIHKGKQSMVSVVTTRARPQEFAWSYSRLKNFETCPKRYYNIDVAKTFKEPDDNEHLMYGKLVHDSLANRVNAEHTPLPPTLKKLEPWAAKVLRTPGKILVEQQLAISKDLQPTSWFGGDAWFRCVVDVLKLNPPVALAIDWKTGKILEDGIQLALSAQAVFSHHPEIQRIRTEFVWLKDDATSRADFSRDDMPDMWASTLPRVNNLKHAHDTQEFPPTPCGLCKRFCPVSSCPHHGVG